MNKSSGNVALKHFQNTNEYTDVLVIGGGPAGTWAAVHAAATGAKVILVDKGYCGTSGATAPSGTGVWYVEPDKEQQKEAMKSREALGGYLAEQKWMISVLNKTYSNMHQLDFWKYPFPIEKEERKYYRSLQGPEYMRLMRKQVKKAGVKIWDHCPVLELLKDDSGISGALGISSQTGERWMIKAGAVIIATGGCAFLSKALGCNVLTGDGYLMASEAGANLSGMEFSNAYAISPVFSSVTKTAFYTWATFYDGNGITIEGAGSQKGRSIIAKTLQTQPVYAILDKADEQIQKWMRQAQPNFFLPFDRLGINPFTDRFPITMRLEGTVRGTGGINVINEKCETKIPGLYAAGDAATREFICGGFTGGGSHNAAWAMSSGSWAGDAAGHFALSLGQKAAKRNVTSTSQVPHGANSIFSKKSEPVISETIKRVQDEVVPYEINLFRTELRLDASLQRLNQLWKEIRHEKFKSSANIIKAREAAAMTATARWMYSAALARKETRGMHKRLDYSEQDPLQHSRILVEGLDHISTQPAAVVKAREVNTI
ncbi:MULTISPECIES: FAD-binding protein [Bacillaceae]|uniref:Pyridine nucleotide-disulfide oxidoreductase n=1 Tax=Domibacillus aminovorans TaxID=29332 RepID=A0A177KX17_9BACI|nr:MULTISPECIES: FAD-binding protein [Bacillaceae]OAH57101.1 pyridine nucleotide-disulfide oxidoreductase [Domibacillus aminovorans]